MTVKYNYIPRHKNGYYINIYAEPVEDYMKAVRFAHEDDLERFLLGRYGPDDPQNFKVVLMKITYELEGDEHVQ